MATLLELAANIVSAHASVSPMSTEDLILEVQKVYTSLQRLEAGVVPASQPDVVEEPVSAVPALTIKQAFKQNEVVCMICGRGGMKTLSRHLNQAHQMKPREYRKQFGIPSTMPLTAKKFSEERKQLAKTINLAANLAKARETRMANIKARKAAPPAEKRGRKKQQ